MNQKSLDKWLILGFRKKIYMMSLEHLAVPESKEMLNTHTHTHTHTHHSVWKYIKGAQ